jgi:signal transduction histidine kinase/DNA-binding response OmpR family regulator
MKKNARNGFFTGRVENKMRLLVVEDEHSLREDIARKLRLSGYEVDACADGEAALEALTAERYDLVLLDLNLPKVDGMQVLRSLRQHDLETCVLILSARSEISDKVEGLDAGANDYLSKPFHLAELEARVRSLTRRKFIQQDVCLCCGRLSFNTRSRVATVDGQTLALTRKESGVLEYLLLHQGRPVSQEELIEHVWDGSVDSFSNSIRVYLCPAQKAAGGAGLRPHPQPHRGRLRDRRRGTMKRLSLQWRITLLAALLIACACVCMNLLLYRTGATGMDALNGFMMQYQPGSEDSLTIEIPQEEMSSLLAHFSQEVYDAKVVFGRKGWCITAVVTILSAAIAYFVSGRALKPLQQLAQQAQRVDQDSIATVRLDEDTVQEFGQLSRSVNRMLDGLAQSFELQRQFAGNAAHELRTPLAILQTKLELFAEEHPAMDAETAGLVSSLREQLDRLTALVRTLLEMSNLQSISRTDQIALAPLVEEILTDLTPLAQKNNISLQQDCAELGMVGSDALIYRLVFNLVENGIKYNRLDGAVRVTLRREKQTAVLRVADTGPGIPADCRESIFQPFFRVDKSRSREMGGVGLGLALVREIAVLHGGSVTVESSSENGTTFVVTLPLAQPC